MLRNLFSSDDTTTTPQAATSRAESRRAFLQKGAVAALATGVVAACKPAAASGTIAEHLSGNAARGGASPAPATPAVAAPLTGRAKADAMDAMHETVMKAFPAKTEGKGNQPLAHRVVGGAKEFHLTAKKLQWETAPGQKTEAWAFNEMVPGPTIRVTEGDRVRVIVHNALGDESTAVHFHGLELPNAMDGVTFITQQPIKPGDSYTYEFTVPVGNHGSHMYHSHHNSTKQVSLGLLGAFIVEPRDKSSEPRADVDYVFILNDGLNGFTINGKSFPATEPIVAKLGQTVRIRFMNEGMMIHPMHLHGMHMTVIAKDGWAQPMPWKCDTLNVAPGERYDVLVKCNNPGTWAFHCHILPHAESEHGMYGMVTALVVKA